MRIIRRELLWTGIGLVTIIATAGTIGLLAWVGMSASRHHWWPLIVLASVILLLGSRNLGRNFMDGP